LEFFLFVIWFWLLLTIFGDLFRDHEMSGGMKALWILFVVVLPYVGILIYLVARGKGMAERSAKQNAPRAGAGGRAHPLCSRCRDGSDRADRPGQGAVTRRYDVPW
jgi:hypothetical protein